MRGVDVIHPGYPDRYMPSGRIVVDGEGRKICVVQDGGTYTVIDPQLFGLEPEPGRPPTQQESESVKNAPVYRPAAVKREKSRRREGPTLRDLREAANEPQAESLQSP
jgi:hypothetical protein